MKPFALKYMPKKTSDIIGQEAALSQLAGFIRNYRNEKNKALLLYGPTGTGKTCSVHAAANEIGHEILEVNASDVRNKEELDRLLGSASKQKSLFYKGKVLLVDEIDGLSGTGDRGGISALAALIDESCFPIVCVATDPFDQKLSPLRKKCRMIEFEILKPASISRVLKNICLNENILCNDSVIDSLARMSGGDCRAAVNDLQMLAEGKKELEKKDLETLSSRERKETIINALLKVLKTTDANIAITAYENLDEDYDKIMLWLDENIPMEYSRPADLARAYDYLSKADIMNRRIKRWQHWRFLVYINAYLSAGVAVSKDEKYNKFVSYRPTMRILKIWQANMRHLKRKEIAEKIAMKTHASHKAVVRDVVPYIRFIFKNNKDLAAGMAGEFGFNEEEVEWLGK